MRIAFATVTTFALLTAACATASDELPSAGPRRADAGIDESSDAALADLDSAGTDTASDVAATDSSATDSASATDGTTTTVDATKPVCGNGKIDPGEICDDGNTSGGDGCSADCASVECTGSRTWEDPATHHCYVRSTDVVSRATAIGKCGEWGGFLVQLETAAERDAVYPATLGAVGGRVWIGLQRLDGAWTWDDGAPASDAELKWGSGEPSGDGSCAEWQEGNKLNDLPCSGDKRDYVCERAPKGS